MDSDDFESLFGAPPRPKQQPTVPTSKKHKKKNKKRNKNKPHLNTSLVADTLGPLSPKSNHHKTLSTTTTPLFKAALLVTLKRDPDNANQIIPTVSQCFPKDQLQDLPNRIEYFCFPDVENIRPIERQAATSFTFVLTAGDGTRTYGFCRRYLPCGRPQQVRLDVGKRYPECLCLVSTYPYISIFDYVLKTLQIRRWLNPLDMAPFLREMRELNIPERGQSFTLNGSGDSKTANVKNTYQTSPLSGQRKSNDNVTSSTSSSPLHRFLRPKDDRVPLTASGIRLFFTRFTPSLVRHILGAVLLERRVIFHSTSITNVSNVIYATLGLLYPFEWQHILVPLLPKSLLEYTCAPSPYIVGIHTSHVNQIKNLPIGEVLIVSVDTGEIVAYGNYESIPIGAASRGRTGSGNVLAAADLVKGAAKEMFGAVGGALSSKYREEHTPLPSVVLTKTFEKLYNQITATKNEDDNEEDNNETNGNQDTNNQNGSGSGSIRTEESWSHSVDTNGLSKMMLIYFGSIFENMNSYIQGLDLFDRDGFIQSHANDQDVQRVLQVLMQTQHFEHFLSQRFSSSTYLFDDLIKSKTETRSRTSSSVSTKVKKAMVANNASKTNSVQTRTLVEEMTSNKSTKRNMNDCYNEIIKRSYDAEQISTINEVLWNRLSDAKGMQWRHGYKSMLLLEVLLKRGSEACVANALDHVRLLHRMIHYRASDKTAAVQLKLVNTFTSGYDGDEKGRGERVRTTAVRVLKLLHETSTLKLLRSKCMGTQDTSRSGTNSSGRSSGGRGSGGSGSGGSEVFDSGEMYGTGSGASLFRVSIDLSGLSTDYIPDVGSGDTWARVGERERMRQEIEDRKQQQMKKKQKGFKKVGYVIKNSAKTSVKNAKLAGTTVKRAVRRARKERKNSQESIRSTNEADEEEDFSSYSLYGDSGKGEAQDVHTFRELHAMICSMNENILSPAIEIKKTTRPPTSTSTHPNYSIENQQRRSTTPPLPFPSSTSSINADLLGLLGGDVTTIAMTATADTTTAAFESTEFNSTGFENIDGFENSDGNGFDNADPKFDAFSGSSNQEMKQSFNQDPFNTTTGNTNGFDAFDDGAFDDSIDNDDAFDDFNNDGTDGFENAAPSFETDTKSASLKVNSDLADLF